MPCRCPRGDCGNCQCQRAGIACSHLCQCNRRCVNRPLRGLVRGVAPVIPLRRIEEGAEYNPFEEPEAIQIPVIPLQRLQAVVNPTANEPEMANQQMQDVLTLMANSLAQNAQLMAQNNQLLVQLGNQAGNQGLRGNTMSLIPTFSGRPTESLTDWEAALNRGAISDVWNNATRRRAAITKLSGAALSWHDQTGHELLDWDEWIAGLRVLFRPRLSLTEWVYMVERRIQLPTETGVEYAMDKAKILRLCPHPLEEAEMVDFLTRGLLRAEHKGALMGTPPATIAAFVESLRNLEQRGNTLYAISSAVAASPYSPGMTETTTSAQGPPSETTALLRTVSSLAETVKRLETKVDRQTSSQQTNWRNGSLSRQDTQQSNQNGGPPYQRPNSPGPQSYLQTNGNTQMQQGQRQQRTRLPIDQVKCYKCNLYGHYQSDCPGRIASVYDQGNDQY